VFAIIQATFYYGGLLAGYLPGVPEELSRCALTISGNGQSEWVQNAQTVSGYFFGTARAAIGAAGLNAASSAKDLIVPIAKTVLLETGNYTAGVLGGMAVEEIKDMAAQDTKVVIEKSMKQVNEILLAQMTQLVPKAKMKGRGRDDWKVGQSGQDGYALKRKLWVNRELQKGKFAKDARCSGFWKVEYHDQ